MKIALIAAGLLVVIVVASVVWFAVSPNLCTVAKKLDGSEGALLIQSGRIIGGPEGMYMFECNCPKYPAGADLVVTPAMVASWSTRRNLHTLRNDDFRIQERSANATIVAVVAWHTRSCFTSGLGLRPAVMFVGTPKTAPRPRRP
jgi:hypothetical protein